jgi:hypothetical protein
MRRNYHSLLVLTISVVALSACSTVKTHVDNGVVSARTFSFLNTGPRRQPGYADKSPQAHAAVQNAISKNLAARGVSYVASGGDVTVAYLIIVGNQVSTSSLSDYFGYSDDANDLLEKTHKAQTIKSENRAYFETGTLVIDFLEPATSKLLQRRSIQADVLRHLDIEQRQARLQGLVNQELSTVDIRH